MKKTLKEFLEEINSYNIPYKEMNVGKHVIVDIPVSHNEYMEVEGTITREIWQSSPNCFSSQIQMTKQNTLTDKYNFSKSLYAVYPEKIKKIF